jgi:hypothetical protein
VSVEELAAALRPRLMRNGGAFLVFDNPDDCRILDVKARDHDVLITFQWQKCPYLLAYGLGPEDGYGASDTLEDWAMDAVTLLQEELGTGLVARSSRRWLGDRIELTAPDWPDDRRFYSDWVSPDDQGSWQPQALTGFEADGFDASKVRRLRDEGRLISWQRLYLNRQITPYVGHAAVSSVDKTTALIDFCDVHPKVPETVTLDLCYDAVHAASWTGVTEVHTRIEDPVLDILGFEHRGDVRVIDTKLLKTDREAAAGLLRATRKWRKPRDLGSDGIFSFTYTTRYAK